MKKRVFSVFVLCLILLSVSMCFSCKKEVATKGWLNDFEQATEIAQEQDKSILLFVSGEDWDGVSTKTRTEILEKPEFIDAMDKEFVLVHLDFSNSLFNATEVAEDATEEEKAKAAELKAELDKKSEVIMNLNINTMVFPVFALLTNNGFVYSASEYSSTLEDVQKYLDFFFSLNETRDKIYEITKRISTSKGVKKAIAIDELIETLPPNHQYLATHLALTVPELDPDNKSGLLGKYQVQVAYSNAIKHVYENDFESAIEKLLEPIGNGILNGEQEQELYFQAAFFYSKMGDLHTEEIIEYLKLAYEAAPNSEPAQAAIKPALNMFLQSLNPPAENQQ